MSLQDDWLVLLQDRNADAFPDEHFAPLITDTEDPVDLQMAFEALPNGKAFIQRIEKVREETLFTGLYHIPDPALRLGKAEMRVLAERYADSVASRLSAIGDRDQADLIFIKPIEFIKKSDYNEKGNSLELPFLNALMDINGDFSAWMRMLPDYRWGLEDAVLFMTMWPAVTRYILSAIVVYPVDDEAYYNLWKGGGNINFCEDRTLVILPDDFQD